MDGNKNVKYYRADPITMLIMVLAMGIVVMWASIADGTPLDRIIKAEMWVALLFGGIAAITYVMQYAKIAQNTLHYINFLRGYHIPIASITKIKRGSTLRGLPLGNAVCIDYQTPNNESRTLCMGATSYKKSTFRDLVAELVARNRKIVVEGDIA